MVGGPNEAVERLRPIFETLAPAKDAGLGTRRAGRGGPLHQDGAQRHRVRHDAGVRRRLLDPQAQEGVLARPGADRRAVATRAASCARGCSTSRRERCTTTRSSPAIAPYVSDSGEGRWTVTEAIDLDVPAPVITLSLLAATQIARLGVVRRSAAVGVAESVRRARDQEDVGIGNGNRTTAESVRRRHASQGHTMATKAGRPAD